ncbi:MAG: hypothetical protein V7K39_25705 [Nostoc sp.]
MNLDVEMRYITSLHKILNWYDAVLFYQYGSVKARDAINRRLYKGLIIVKTAIYRVFAISGVSSKNLIRTLLTLLLHSLQL